MINRTASSSLIKISRSYPVVAITGPRQSGKTTISRWLFKNKPYINLEDLEQQQFAREDPKGFLSQFPDGAIIDEAQRAPHLFNYIQVIVDNQKKMGHFILTGSQQFGLFSNITQSLAGRVGLLQLLPLSMQELQEAKKFSNTLEVAIFKGFYPPIFDRNVDPSSWFSNYVRTYIERDMRSLIQVKELSRFQTFVRLCAGRTGQLLNLSSLGADCGISHNTAKEWLSILETSYIAYTLRPHFNNFNKRLVKTKKLYFYDSGLLCWLLGIQDAQQLTLHPLRGSIFESFVISEFIKSAYNHEREPHLYFWRDYQGHEIDIIIDRAGLLTPVEIKSGKTMNSSFLDSLKKWTKIAQDQASPGHLIYGGNYNQKRSDINIWAWNKFINMTKI